jgi:hypothetical protein
MVKLCSSERHRVLNLSAALGNVNIDDNGSEN